MEPIPLEEVDVHLLEPLLREETRAYRTRYRWDFTGTAELVRKLVEKRALGGMALVEDGAVAGYAYYVVEDRKAQVGDVYVMAAHAGAANERLLMATTLEALRPYKNVKRVEAQPMQLRYAFQHPHAQLYERVFLELDLQRAEWGGEFTMPAEYRIEPWSARVEADVADVLFQAYRGHTDAEINDQFRSPYRARDYVANMVTYPICGVHYSTGSYVVQSLETGRYAGFVSVCLSAFPGDGGEQRVGHVAQIAVAPEHRGKGLGRQLMRAALAGLADAGCGHATLTVTESNRPALGLYRSLGFEERERLFAYVWPAWPF
jgi:ribosomal protein S18 acetylase RimI-like enzyme